MDQEIYSLCSSFEGETLRMMDRLYKFSSIFDFDDSFESRRRMFLLHCSFWYQYLVDKKITHVAFLGVPHEVYSFVVYKLASLLNIKTIILYVKIVIIFSFCCWVNKYILVKFHTMYIVVFTSFFCIKNRNIIYFIITFPH